MAVALDSCRLERPLEMGELLDTNDATALHVDDSGPAAEEVRAPALQRTLVARIDLDAREPHAHDDTIREPERPIDGDVVALSHPLGEDLEHTVATDEDGLLAGGDPFDVGIEHPRDRLEVAGDERAVTAKEKLDARVFHAAESMGLVRVLSNPQTDVLYQRLTKRDWPQVRREKASPHDRSRDGKLKFGTVSGALMEVLAAADRPMRYVEIRAAVEQQLGMTVAASSVKQLLSDEANHRKPRFERVARGTYRIRRSPRDQIASRRFTESDLSNASGEDGSLH